MPAESVRQARLLGGTPVTGGWQLLRLHLPELQGRLRLGQRLRITTATGSLEAYVYYLAADWFALLAPPGAGLQQELAGLAEIAVTGPLTSGWRTLRSEEPAVVLAAGPAMAAALALARQLQPPPRLVLLDSAGLVPPFRLQPSLFMVNGLPSDVIAAPTPLEQAGIPARLADPSGRPGCFEGGLAELFRLWHASHPSSSLEVFTCLPPQATATLRRIPGLHLHDADDPPAP